MIACNGIDSPTTRVFARPPVRGRPRARQPVQQQQQQQQQQQRQQPTFQNFDARTAANLPSRVIDPSPGGIPSDPLAVLRAIASPGATRGGGGGGGQSSGSRARGQASRTRARPSGQRQQQKAAERPRTSSSGGANRFASFPAQDTGRRPTSANFAPARQPEAVAAPSAPRRPVRIRNVMQC